MAAPLDRVKALLAALPREDQAELQRYLDDILVSDDEAEAIQVASLEERTRGGRTITYTYRQERVRCGKGACWCAEGGLGHGPYTYKYWRDEKGKLRKEYVGAANREPGAPRPVRPRGRRGAGARARGSSAASSSGPAPPA
ncbi:MAG TPA: DUF6788 family protein [Candidatus Thermoplasmatota archaeon]|nr:DUF6788 family protein [Candidatus Thermoplasmatota archaeon]